MPDYVSLPVLNDKRFNTDPVEPEKLQRWCREGRLPARKIGGEWRVDIEQFDNPEPEDLDPMSAAVLEELKKKTEA